MRANLLTVTTGIYSLFFSNICLALDGVTIPTEPGKINYVASVSLGNAWSSAGQQQQFYLRQNLEQTFTANRPNNSLVAGEIFFGIQQSITSRVMAQMGIAYVMTDSVKLNGDIWDDADPAFNNYTYSYEVNHQHAAIKLKLIIDSNTKLHPYVSGSAGIGYNQSHSYQNTPSIPEAVTNPNFANKTVSDFTYTLGLGAQVDIAHHFSAGLGYEFDSWGRSQLGSTPSQTVNGGLSLNNIYTSQVIANLTYVS